MKYIYKPISKKKTMLIPLENIVNGDVSVFLLNYITLGVAVVNKTEGILRITNNKLRKRCKGIKC